MINPTQEQIGNMEQLEHYLLNNNWKEYQTEAVAPELTRKLWCKPRIPGKEVLFDLYYSKFKINDTITETISLSIQSKVEGTWFMLQAYSMSVEHYLTHAEEIEHKLFSAWTNLHTN